MTDLPGAPGSGDAPGAAGSTGGGVQGDVGALHHLEFWVADLAVAEREWGWLLGRLGHVPADTWPTGRSWASGAAYVVVESGPAVAPGGHDRLRPGLDHVAFTASRALVDEVAADGPAHGWTLLFADQHPSAGGPGTYAAYLVNGDGFEAELVAPSPRRPVAPSPGRPVARLGDRRGRSVRRAPVTQQPRRSPSLHGEVGEVGRP